MGTLDGERDQDADKRTHELFVTGKAWRFPPDIARRAVRKLEYVDLTMRLDDLKIPPAKWPTTSKAQSAEGLRRVGRRPASRRARRRMKSS